MVGPPCTIFCFHRKEMAEPLPPLFAVRHSAQRPLVCPCPSSAWNTTGVRSTLTHLVATESLAPVKHTSLLGHATRDARPTRYFHSRHRCPKGTEMSPLISWNQNHFRFLSCSMWENSVLSTFIATTKGHGRSRLADCRVPGPALPCPSAELHRSSPVTGRSPHPFS